MKICGYRWCVWIALVLKCERRGGGEVKRVGKGRTGQGCMLHVLLVIGVCAWCLEDWSKGGVSVVVAAEG